MLVLLFPGACSEPQSIEYADIVIQDARVWTGDAGQPWAEALASRDDGIVAIGNNADVQALIIR